MSDSAASLARQIGSAADLQSVVRTMKAVAASSVGQYERSVLALADYSRTVELGLNVCLRASAPSTSAANHAKHIEAIGAIVFGSDQGLVGQFNEVIADFTVKTLAGVIGKTVDVWAVGERVHARLLDAGLPVVGLFPVPSSVKGIAALVGEIQTQSEARRAASEYSGVYVFHNRPQTGALYEPVRQRLLPLDSEWESELAKRTWPTKVVPEVVGGTEPALRMMIREYLFISLFRACAESLASENASRLAAMQRAEKNIDELMTRLNSTFHRLRQSGIDEELFDVISGFEALNQKEPS